MVLYPGVSAEQGIQWYIEGDLGRAGSSLVKPRMPWYGLQSGIWTKQDEEEAKLAVKGEYFMTGDKQKDKEPSRSAFLSEHGGNAVYNNHCRGSLVIYGLVIQRLIVQRHLIEYEF